MKRFSEIVRKDKQQIEMKQYVVDITKLVKQINEIMNFKAKIINKT